VKDLSELLDSDPPGNGPGDSDPPASNPGDSDPAE
jgi:hypothetical protein